MSTTGDAYPAAELAAQRRILTQTAETLGNSTAWAALTSTYAYSDLPPRKETP